MHNSFYKLIKQAIEDNGKTQDIREFAGCFEGKFNPYEQHDAQEFFLHVGNLLQEEMRQDFSVPKSFRDP